MRPPANVPQGGYAVPAQQDSASLLLRIDRLENALRTLNGQVEQLQFQNRQLTDQLQRFQRDVDFRFQEQGGSRRSTQPPAGQTPPQRRTETPAPADDDTFAAETGSGGPMTPQQILPPAQRSAQRSDSFDPSVAPDAPGAPRPLGSTPPSAPLVPPRASGPVGLPGGPIVIEDGETRTGAVRGPVDLRGGQSGQEPLPSPPRAVASIPATGTGVGPRDDYTAAVAALRAGQFEAAETGLKGYIQRNPTDRFVPDAIYYLGESYSQRGRHREAAEQYLKVSTDYAKSSRAPDGMLRLGTSLVALGATEQACATYGEIARRYPNATSAIRNADAQMKRAKC